MAKDFDFKRQPKKPPLPKPEVQAAPIARPSQESAPVVAAPERDIILPDLPPKNLEKKRTNWVLIVLLIILVGVLVLLVYYTTRPSIAGLSSNTSGTVVPSIDSGNQSTAVAAITKPDANTIQVFDGGAGTAATGQIKSLLQANNYQVDPIKQSRYEYDKTYIRYRENNQTMAQAIALLLKNRQVELQQSDVTDSQSIVIFVGKN